MASELNLPVIEGGPPPPVPRSMDEIDAWIEHDYRHFFDREVYQREKRLNAVNIRFSLD